MKSGQNRIDDAVNYIHGLGKSELANHLATTVRTGNASAIGKELSLGSRPDGDDAPNYTANTNRRNALRALLLCQRVYFSNLWWTFSAVGGAQSKINMLPANWKAISLLHWGLRNEQEIVEGILTFSVTTGSLEALVTAAGAAPTTGVLHPDLTLTRAKNPFPGMINCYGSVMTWLFKSGLASYRWYAKHSGASNEATLRAAFGPALVVIRSDQPFTLASVFPHVPRGHIVHLYCDTPARWPGHWLVSLGNGNARGCNNDDTDGTNRNYTASCSLTAQFVNGYRDRRPDGTFWNGIAEVINPLEIPGRM